MSTQKPKTILLVEDEVLIALAEMQTIESFGYKVHIANSGEKAVAMATGNEKPDIILMDIDLGKGISGPEAAAAILSKNTIPIVFLTSHSERETVAKVRDITRYGYVIKNSGDFVLQSSIAMAFELFDAFQRLTDSEDKYSAAFRTSPDSVNINSMDGRYVDINEGFTKLTGYKRADVIGVLSSEIKIWAIPEDRDKLVMALKEKGAVDDLESSFRCKDGSLKTCLMSARVIKFNGQSHILSITRDISERKRMEEALRESELKYRSLIEFSSDVIFCVNERGEYKFTNQKFASTFGKSPGYFLGKTLWDVYSKEQADIRYAAITKVFKTGVGESVEVDVPLPDRTLHFLGKVNPIKNETGDVILALTYSTDITERRDVERELQLIKAAVGAASDAIGVSTSTGEHLYQNKAFDNLFGYTQEEMRSMHPAQLHVDKDLALNISKAIQAGESCQGEAEMVAKNGRQFRVLFRTDAIKDTIGNVVGWIGIHTDISGRKKSKMFCASAKRTS